MHALRKKSLLIIFLALASPSLIAQNPARENADALKRELDREWLVVILPFSADDNEVMRSTPLVQSLPGVMEESLKLLRRRWLDSRERTGYIENLKKRFPEEAILSEVLPEYRTITYASTDIESNLQKQLYFSSLREHLRNETPFSSDLIARLQEETQADLFIAGNVQIQNQYAFIDLLLISPYLTDTAGIPSLTQNLFSLRSIEALSEIRLYIARDLGQNIYNAPAGSLEFGEPPDGTTVRVYIDDEYWGTAPLFAAPIPVGTHKIELYEGRKTLLSAEREILENETTQLEIPLDQTVVPQFSLSTIPSGLAVYEDSSFLGYTPLLVNRPENTIYLQISGDDVRESYLKVDNDIMNNVSVTVPQDLANLRDQLSIDREQFYASLGFTVLSGIIPLILTGLGRDLLAVNITGWSSERRLQHINEYAAVRVLTLSSTWITLISIVNTIGELFDYLETVEAARSVITPEIP